MPPSPKVPVALLVTALFGVCTLSLHDALPISFWLNPVPVKARVAGWLAEPKIWKLAPLALVRAEEHTAVPAPQSKNPWRTRTDKELASVPVIVRLPPPSPEPASTLSTPALA